MNKIVHELDVKNFQSTLDAYPQAIYVIDFWATWCGPCKQMGPIIDELAEEFSGSVRFAKVDIGDEKNLPLIERFNITSIPTIKILKAGEEVSSTTGLTPKDDLHDVITKVVGQQTI
jgi:thioredoxin 1